MCRWLIPFIGHMGITDSEGTIYDFAGPYFINVSKERTGFGPPAKVWVMDGLAKDGGGSEAAEIWDSAVRAASDEFSGRMHNLFCNNCHDHVALSLNLMHYPGTWGMISVWFWMMVYSSYTSYSAILRTYLPSLIIYSILFAFLYLPFLVSPTEA